MDESNLIQKPEHFDDTFQQREWINVSTMGHVSHGKSTLLGYFLWKLGIFTEEDLKREGGKFAFLMDRTEEEKRRGMSIQESYKSFELLKKLNLTFIDNPGHHDFLRNLVTGLTVSQVGIIVIDCREYEKALSSYPGITKMQIHIARFLHVKQFIVVISKMDLVRYDMTLYRKAVSNITDVLNKAGVNSNNIPIIPTAILDKQEIGHNIIRESTEMLWYNGMTFYQALNTLGPSWHDQSLPLRAHLMRHFNIPRKNIFSVYIRQGTISVGDNVVVLPKNIRGKVQSIHKRDSSNRYDTRESNVSIQEASAPMLVSVDLNTKIKFGDTKSVKGGLICDESNMPIFTNSIVANILTMPSEPESFMSSSVRIGEEFLVELATARIPATIDEIMSVSNVNFFQTKNTAEEVRPGSVGHVRLQLLRPSPVDTIMSAGQLSRFLMRSRGKLIGGGVILDTQGFDFLRTFEQLNKKDVQYKDSWTVFEKFILALFTTFSGISCEYQAVSKGMRSDLFVTSSLNSPIWSEIGTKLIIECKFWRNKYGPDIVFKLAGQIVFSGCNSGIIVSMKGPNNEAIDIAAEFCRRELTILHMGEDDILRLIKGDSMDDVLTNMRRRIS